MQIIWNDDKDAVKEWLEENDSQVMVKDSHGFAPIHYAAKFNRHEIMKLLVKHGAGMLFSNAICIIIHIYRLMVLVHMLLNTSNINHTAPLPPPQFKLF